MSSFSEVAINIQMAAQHGKQKVAVIEKIQLIQQLTPIAIDMKRAPIGAFFCQ
jgi:hypothetical protein